ncbi:MAG: hypothetical protein KFF77_10525, partial [Bacteroidetes bacterium]|nr:hypothetical protein [Bacteroidota bacterium]
MCSLILLGWSCAIACANAMTAPQERTAAPQERASNPAVSASALLQDSARIATLRRQAMAEIRRERLPEGRRLLEEACRLAEARGDEQQRFSLLQHIATTHEAEGALSRALELLLSCLSFQERKGNVREQAMLHLNIGNLYYRIGSIEQALFQHRRAAILSDRAATPYIRGRIHFALGCDFQGLGDKDSAKICLATAERIAREAGDTEGFAQARTRLGFIHIDQGRLNDALSDFTSVLSQPGIEEYYFVHAQALRGSGQVRVASGDYRAAVDAFENAAEVCGSRGLRELLLDILSDLAAAHEAMGQYHAAYAVARRRAVARDSLSVVQNRAQMNELLARYEAGQREQQILLLEKDNRLKASELQREQLRARERAAAIELLAQQNANQQLRLDLTSAELREQAITSREKEQHLLLEQKENILQKSVLVQQRFERNAFAAGL